MQRLDALPPTVPTDIKHTIKNTTLPPILTDYAAQYDTHINDRDPYLWKWLYSVFDTVQVPTVPEQFRETARETKVLVTMYIVLADDLAEVYGDTETFREVAKVPFDATPTPNPDRHRVEYIEFAQLIWDEAELTLEDAPRYDDFYPLFEFDFRQTVHAMRYSQLVNSIPYLANFQGTKHYGPHNMSFITHSDIDLLFSPDFPMRELGELRGLLWDAQYIAEMGNWITTWERELEEHDYASGVLVYAVTHDLVSVAELESGQVSVEELEQRIREAGIQEQFLQEWGRIYESLRTRADATAGDVDMAMYMESLETLLAYQLASRGEK